MQLNEAYLCLKLSNRFHMCTYSLSLYFTYNSNYLSYEGKKGGSCGEWRYLLLSFSTLSPRISTRSEDSARLVAIQKSGMMMIEPRLIGSNTGRPSGCLKFSIPFAGASFSMSENLNNVTIFLLLSRYL